MGYINGRCVKTKFDISYNEATCCLIINMTPFWRQIVGKALFYEKGSIRLVILLFACRSTVDRDKIVRKQDQMKIFDSGKFRFVSKSFERIYIGSYVSELFDTETHYNYNKIISKLWFIINLGKKLQNCHYVFWTIKS